MFKRDKIAFKDKEKELNKLRQELKKLKEDYKLLQDKEITVSWNLESKESLIKDLRG